MDETVTTVDAVELATALTIAWLENANTRTDTDDVPAFLKSMFDSVSRLSESSVATEPVAVVQDYIPAVTARKSLANPAHIISLIDGKPYKTLRRHLSGHGLSPEQYRERYNLKPDYPMVAPDYSEARRSMAKKIGLGRKVGKTVAAKPAPKPAAPAKARPKLHLGANAGTAPRKRVTKPKASAKA
jgi:predicted transcriptional regulator